MGLARHMAEQGLVRARGYDGAFARHLDLDVLREALSQMLREQWEEGYLIVRLLIEQREPELVARELEVSHAELLDMSRDALEDLGTYYEDVAFGALGQSAQEQAPGKARSAGKRR
jgi:hypothetical protein